MLASKRDCIAEHPADPLYALFSYILGDRSLSWTRFRMCSAAKNKFLLILSNKPFVVISCLSRTRSWTSPPNEYTKHHVPSTTPVILKFIQDLNILRKAPTCTHIRMYWHGPHLFCFFLDFHPSVLYNTYLTYNMTITYRIPYNQIVITK